MDARISPTHSAAVGQPCGRAATTAGRQRRRLAAGFLGTKQRSRSPPIEGGDWRGDRGRRAAHARGRRAAAGLCHRVRVSRRLAGRPFEYCCWGLAERTGCLCMGCVPSHCSACWRSSDCLAPSVCSAAGRRTGGILWEWPTRRPWKLLCATAWRRGPIRWGDRRARGASQHRGRYRCGAEHGGAPAACGAKSCHAAHPPPPGPPPDPCPR